MCRIGYGKTKREITNLVQKIVLEDGRATPFKGGVPGQKWWEGFMRRHPRVGWRKAELLGKERATVTNEKLDKWFVDLVDYLEQDVEGGVEIMTKANRLFNADEIGFPLQGKTERVLAPKGARDVYQQGTSDKTQITVLACVSASGMVVPPMIIHPGTRLRYDPTQGAPAGTCLGRTPTGWIDSGAFYEWVANHFEPFIHQNHIQLPVILFVDGHASHINLDTSEFCNVHGILLYCLPPHTTHILQPCDVSVFRGLKARWTTAVRDFQSHNIGDFVTKATFARVFNDAWKLPSLQNSAINGFSKCGLYPFTKEFDRSKLAASAVYANPLEALADVAAAAATIPTTLPDAPTPSSTPAFASTPSSTPASASTPPSNRSTLSTGSLSSSAAATTLPTTVPLSPTTPPPLIYPTTPPPLSTSPLPPLSPTLSPASTSASSLSVPAKSSHQTFPTSSSLHVTPEHWLDVPSALNLLERSFHDYQLNLFNRRFREGFDLAIDPLYVAWKTLKTSTSSSSATAQASTSTPPSSASATSSSTPSTSTSCTTPSKKAPPRKRSLFVSSAFDKHLHYPQVLPKKKKTARSQELLPRAISGVKWRQFLKDRETKRIEEENAKKERLELREKKRLEKEQQKKKKKTTKTTKNSRKNVTEDEDLTEMDTTDDDTCAKCGLNVGDACDWIGCGNCSRWFHKKCTDIADIDLLSPEEIDEIEYDCDICLG